MEDLQKINYKTYVYLTTIEKTLWKFQNAGRLREIKWRIGISSSILPLLHDSERTLNQYIKNYLCLFVQSMANVAEEFNTKCCVMRDGHSLPSQMQIFKNVMPFGKS